MSSDAPGNPRWIAVAALLSALAAGCVHGPPPGSPATKDAAFDQGISLEHPERALIAAAIFSQTNRVRAAHGAAPLQRSPQLDCAADEQALHMTLMLRTEHSNPIAGEHTAAERVTSAGFRAALVAENAIMLPARPPAGSQQAAYTYSGLAAAIVGNWMDSPGHRANLLSREVTSMGCAAWIARDALGGPMVFATQVFALPASAGTGER